MTKAATPFVQRAEKQRTILQSIVRSKADELLVVHGKLAEDKAAREAEDADTTTSTGAPKDSKQKTQQAEKKDESKPSAPAQNTWANLVATKGKKSKNNAGKKGQQKRAQQNKVQQQKKQRPSAKTKTKSAPKKTEAQPKSPPQTKATSDTENSEEPPPPVKLSDEERVECQARLAELKTAHAQFKIQVGSKKLLYSFDYTLT